MNKYKLGDTVKITAGKDKGREGKIEKIFPKEDKVLIMGINVYKKHVKGVQGQKGGIYDVPRPLNVAKIAIICPKCKKVTRAGFRVMSEKSGKTEKVRICKKCEKEI